MHGFTHLHNHTDYSFLDGATHVSDLCKKGYDLGMTSLAITDHGNLCGSMSFYLECKKYDIKPIIGCEFYLCEDHRDQSSNEERNHIVLLAKDKIGYANLMKLSSISWQSEYFYRKPRIDKKLLYDHSEGLICLSACISGEIPKAIIAGNRDRAREVAREMAAIFPGRFYLEIQKNGIPEQEAVNFTLLEIGESEKISIVATNDCHYLDTQDRSIQEILRCIGTGKKLSDPDRLTMGAGDFSFKTPEAMRRAFKGYPQALENAIDIAKQCNVTLEVDQHFLPEFPFLDGRSADAMLADLAFAGLKQRGVYSDAIYRERLDMELDVIKKAGFSTYLLIVQEYVNYARNQGIPVGPGRGSAVGSLVVWTLGITHIDPIRYGLYFERFLNPERASLPDIDVDFCDKRRKEIVQHIIEVYGAERVAPISTFSRMHAKGAIKDVARVLGFSFQDQNKIPQMIPEKDEITIREALAENSEFSNMYEADKKYHELIDLAIRVEGTIKNPGIHASGLLIADVPLDTRIPTWIKKEKFAVQFEGPLIEQTGIVKYDILGLRTLSLIQDALQNIKASGKNVPNIESLNLNDEVTYALLASGDTRGVFQLERDGITTCTIQLKPERFEDLVAILALFRPGPLKNSVMESFIKRKHGEEEITYPHPSLEDCLKETYGLPIYQEQAMEMAKIVAGYSLGEADTLRRVMSKKKIDEMAAERTRFMDGAKECGLDTATAQNIFSQIEKFAEYGFNKSHAVAYAFITYQTAWLKAHYPLEYYAALLTDVAGEDEKKALFLAEIRKKGLDCIGPDINQSMGNFTAENGKIRWGMKGIRGIGDPVIAEIIQKRVNGPFISLQDLCKRVNKSKVKRNVLAALIKAGACDCLRKSRKAMLRSLENILAILEKTKEGEQPAIPDFPDCPEFQQKRKLSDEKEVLGVYLSGHPLDVVDSEGCDTIEMCAGLKGNKSARCIVQILSVKKWTTKKGDPMAFLGVEDRTTTADIIIWPELFRETESLLKKGEILKLTIKAAPKNAKYDNGKLKFVAEEIEQIMD